MCQPENTFNKTTKCWVSAHLPIIAFRCLLLCFHVQSLLSLSNTHDISILFLFPPLIPVILSHLAAFAVNKNAKKPLKQLHCQCEGTRKGLWKGNNALLSRVTASAALSARAGHVFKELLIPLFVFHPFYFAFSGEQGVFLDCKCLMQIHIWWGSLCLTHVWHISCLALFQMLSLGFINQI